MLMQTESVDVLHPLTSFTPRWLNCRDKPNICGGARAQPILLNDSAVYARGMNDQGKCIPWKYSVSLCSWSPLPIPPGLNGYGDNYVLATYQGQLVWIGGHVSNSEHVYILTSNKRVFVFGEDEGWKDTIPSLPVEFHYMSGISASSEDNYLIIAWREDNYVKLLIFNGQEWTTKEGPPQCNESDKIDIIIHNGMVYVMNRCYGVSHFHVTSVESLLVTNDTSWKELKSIPYEHSNLTLFGGYLTVVTKMSSCALAFSPNSKTWIELCDFSHRTYSLMYSEPESSIIGLPNGTLLLMGAIRLDKSNQILQFDVLEVTAKGMLCVHHVVYTYTV